LVTVPFSLLSATALLVLKALLTLEVAEPPFNAAAPPVPSALTRPRLLRLSPTLLSFPWSLLFRLLSLF
jgi:hypothetical protein